MIVSTTLWTGLGENRGYLWGLAKWLSVCLPLVIFILTVCIVAVIGREALGKGELWAILVVTSTALLSVMTMGVIWRQPESKTKLSFKVSSLA